MKASDVMTRDVRSCTADEGCDAAARIMCKEDVGVVPVVDPQGAVVGLVTDRDLMKSAWHTEKPLKDIPVKEAMTRNVISVRPEDELQHVEELMQVNQIRRLPVIDDDGILRGIVSMADLARTIGTTGTDAELPEYEVAETLGAVSQPHATTDEAEQGDEGGEVRDLHVHV